MKYSWGRAVLPLLLFFATILLVNAEIITFQETVLPGSEAIATIDVKAAGDGSVIFDISIPAAHLFPKSVAGTEYQVLSVRGFSHLHKLGKPMVPACNYLLAVASGTAPEFTVLYKDPVVLDNYLLHPAIGPYQDYIDRTPSLPLTGSSTAGTSSTRQRPLRSLI
jgi:hypothetical protein